MFIKIPIRKRRDFLKNNYKTQTISLVSKRFKLISFIRIRVQWNLFRKNWCGENMEIEFNELGFHVHKPSSMYLVSMYRNRVHWTRFPYMEIEFVELCFWALFLRVECLKMELFYLLTLSVFTLRRLHWYIFLHIFWQLHLMLTATIVYIHIYIYIYIYLYIYILYFGSMLRWNDQLLSNGAILPSPKLKLRLLRSVLVVLCEWEMSVFA